MTRVMARKLVLVRHAYADGAGLLPDAQVRRAVEPALLEQMTDPLLKPPDQHHHLETYTVDDGVVR